MPDARDISFSLTALVDKESKKVLLAEADNDFIDILLSFLTLPLGTIMKVLQENMETIAPVIGSLTTLYRGLSDLSDYHFWGGRFKPDVISPRRSGMTGVKLKLQIGSEIKDAIPNGSKRPRTAPFGFDGEGLTVKSASFMISDDLKIVPVEPGYVRQTLTNVGITEMDKAEIRTRTFGYFEILDLLELSLLSKTPLTDLFFREERCVRDCSKCLEKISQQLLQQVMKEKPSEASSKKMTVKAVIQKSTNKILFVEAGDDFLDFLCSFLVTPLGALECLLGGNTGLHSIDSLYGSMSNIDGDKYFRKKEFKSMLLKPQLFSGYHFEDNFLPLVEKDSSSFMRGKFVKENTMYNVTDDLTVTPFNMASSFSLLSRHKIPLSDLDEVELVVGLDEALRILKASLTSTSALTDGLMNSI